MIKKFSYFIFNIIAIFDKLLFLFFKRSFLIYFGDKFNSYLYIRRKINNKVFKFFTPNSITRWRANTLEKEEPKTIRWIENFNKTSKDLIFWDIGANIGLYSLYSAKIHKNIKIISFEPSPSNLRVLSRNISINNLHNKITIFQIPLTDKGNAFLQMNESKFMEGWAMHTFGQNKGLDGKKLITENKYKIFGTSIKNILDNKILEIPNYIKIDVDGIENLILAGAKNYLDSKKIRSIMIEVDENYKTQVNQIQRIMKKYNFSLKGKHNLPHTDKKFDKTFNYLYEKK